MHVNVNIMFDIKSNYMISDVTVEVLNGRFKVNEFFVAISDGTRYTGQIKRKAPLYINGGSTEERNLKIDLSDYAGSGYQIRIIARISTGLEKTVYQGTIA